MTPSFFALFSRAGIACAADAYHTIYRLSDKRPVAIAVNPESPIPWEKIIKKSQEQLAPTPQASFVNYANEFDLFLSTIETKDSWKDLSPEESNILFLGYGEDDIFPSAYDTLVQIDENGMMGLGDGELSVVALDKEPAFFSFMGDVECVSPLLFGASSRIQEYFYDCYSPVCRGYVEKVAEQVKGKPYEQRLISRLMEHDYTEDINEGVGLAVKKSIDGLSLGVATFSVEDMVSAVEAIVDANARLGHLRSGASGEPGETKEIAVVTIPEGVSWIINSEIKRRKQA